MPTLRQAACLFAALASMAQAEPISLQRGVNLDPWLDWPSIADLKADPSQLDIFPDVRRDITPEMYANLLAQGFDFVRMPIDPAPMLAFGPGERQDRMIEGTRIAAQTILDAGLKVIVDLHPIGRGTDVGSFNRTLNEDWPEFRELVGRIAASLDGLPPDRTALEILNEPTIDCDAVYAGARPRWPAMQAELHALARAAAPDVTIVLTGACWGQANALATMDPGLIRDDNVLWTFHSYDPYLFTHQGAVWVGPPERHFWDLPYPPSAVTDEIAEQVTAAAVARMAAEQGEADVDMIRRAVADYRGTPDEAVSQDIQRAAAWADWHGIPRSHVLLGEFGALHRIGDRSMPRAWFLAFLRDKRQAAESEGMPWAVLTYVGDMGIADADAPGRRIDPETCRALGLPCGD